MRNITSRKIIAYCFLIILSLAAFTGSVYADVSIAGDMLAPQQFIPGNLSGPLSYIQSLDDDPDSLLANKLRLRRPLFQGALSNAIINRQLPLAQNRSATIRNAVSRVFQRHTELKNDLDRNRHTIMGEPEINIDHFEFDDSIVILNRTEFIVNDPISLAHGSRHFREFLGNRSPVPVTTAGWSPEKRQALTRYIQDEIPRLAPNDPLRIAASRGESSLLQAIAEGKGKIAITDTMVLRKTPIAGLFTPGVNTIVSPGLDHGVEQRATSTQRRADTRPVVLPGRTEQGKYLFETYFLAGFTRHGGWEWERRWDFPTGFFRITLGAEYGLGCRIPIGITGEVEPANVTIRDVQDKPVQVRTKLTARTDDADVAFFRRTGLPNNAIFGAKEALLEGRIYFGYNTRVFWSTPPYGHLRNAWYTLGTVSQHLSFPLGRRGEGSVIGFPASETGTEINFGIASGSAQIGVRLAGNGEVGLDLVPVMGESSLQRQAVVLGDSELPVTMNYPAMGRGETSKTLGIKLENPKYALDLSLIPAVKINLDLGVDWLHRHFDTGWIDIDALSVDVGSLTFDRHAGTQRTFAATVGEKRFEAIEDFARPLRDGDSIAIQSDHTGKYVRAGLTNNALLGAVSTEVRGWERFKLYMLPGGNIALQSEQNGKFIRAGLSENSYLGALSDRVAAWETFRLIVLPGNKYALQSVQNGKYVRAGLGQESLVGASSSRFDAWERFKIWPLNR